MSEQTQRTLTEVMADIEAKLGYPSDLYDELEKHIDDLRADAAMPEHNEGDVFIHEHTFAPVLGGIDVKVTDGRDAIGVEVDVKRPREAGESWQDCKNAAVNLATTTYLAQVAMLASGGVKVGPRAKEAKA